MSKLFVTRKRKCTRCGKPWTIEVPKGYTGQMFLTCPTCYRKSRGLAA